MRGTEWDFMLEDNRTLLVGGCGCYEIPIHKDERGFLYELVKDESSNVLMSYFSHTNPLCARDFDMWHLHKVQTDRFVVVYGCAVFALSDGKMVQCVTIHSDSPRMLVIPPYVYHCFRATFEPVGLINFPTELYNPDDEFRIPHEELGLFAWDLRK